MIKFLSSKGFKTFFALAFVMVVFAVNTNAQKINEILNRIETHRKSLNSLRSDISMGKFNPDLSEWDNSSGKIILVAKNNSIKDGLLRIDWKSPKEEILAVAKGKYYAYTPGLKVVYVGSASAKEAEKKGGSIFSFLSMSKAQLNANYTTNLAGEEKLKSGVDTFRLRITPKGESKYKNAEIWVDNNGMIHQVRVVPTSGDENIILLSNIEKNVDLSVSQFSVQWPKDTKVVNS